MNDTKNRKWGLQEGLLIGVVAAAGLAFHHYSNLPAGDVPKEEATALKGSISSHGMFPGQDMEDVRKRLGDLDVAIIQDREILFLGLGGAEMVAFEKQAKENDLYKIKSIMCADVDRDNHPWLKVGMTRAKFFEALGRPEQSGPKLQFRFEGRQLRVEFHDDEVQSFLLLGRSDGPSLMHGLYFTGPAALPPPPSTQARAADPVVIQAVLGGRGYVSSRAAQRIFCLEACQLLNAHQFPQLEKLLAAARTRPDLNFTTPTDPVKAFFDGLLSYGNWENNQQDLRSWAAASKSPLAQVGGAWSHLWEKEPSGGERYLKAVPSDSKETLVELFPLLLLSWFKSDKPFPRAVELYDKASNVAVPVRTEALSLVIRGQAPSLTDQFLKLAPSPWEQALRIALLSDTANRAVVAQEPSLKDFKLRPGFEDLLKRYPSSSVLANAAARIASEGSDREWSKACLARLGSQWDPVIWRSYATYAARCAQAGLTPATPEGMGLPHFVPAGPEAGLYPVPLVQGEPLAEQALDLLYREQFAELEAIAAGLRGSDGERSVSFYEGLAERSLENKSDYETRFGLLRHWQLAYPKSSTVAIAQAMFSIHFAWQARGSGYANTVTPAAWKLFRERLAAGAGALERVKERDPSFYDTSITMVKATGGKPERVVELARESQESHPKHLATYIVVAEYFLPRWFGKDGGLGAVADELAQKAPGNGIYTLMTAFNFSYDKLEIFEDSYPSKLPWDKAVTGLEELRKLKLLTPRVAQQFAQAALAKGDRPALRQALRGAGGTPLKEVISTQKEWEDLHRWAKGKD